MYWRQHCSQRICQQWLLIIVYLNCCKLVCMYFNLCLSCCSFYLSEIILALEHLHTQGIIYRWVDFHTWSHICIKRIMFKVTTYSLYHKFQFLVHNRSNMLSKPFWDPASLLNCFVRPFTYLLKPGLLGYNICPMLVKFSCSVGTPCYWEPNPK